MLRFLAFCVGRFCLAGACVWMTAGPLPAQTPPGAGAAPRPAPYADWTKGAEKQSGLFTVWRKEGKIYLELAPDQLDKDYLQTAVPANGLGGFGILSGQMFAQDARLLRFERDDARVAVVWQQTSFAAPPGTPLAEAVRLSTANSVVGVAPVVSEDAASKHVVIDMSLLLGDVMNFNKTIAHLSNPRDPLSQYHLDPTRSYFGTAKAFPSNVVIEADQTWASVKPPDWVNTVVDPRSIQMRVTYNLIALPENDGYMPRIEDDRVGYWEIQRLRFDQLNANDDIVHYVLRRNIQPSDPSQRISPARNPVVYTLSNSIPVEYRDAVRRAILAWNKAFERIGISDAVEVQDQPADPAWDPDDFRYNVVRWVTNVNRNGFAEAQVVWDPRTGEILRSGIIIDSDFVHLGNLLLRAQNPSSEIGAEPGAGIIHDDGPEMAAEFAFGAVAQALLTGEDPVTTAKREAVDFLYSAILHEIGHDWGLAHNFIAHDAYTEKELRDKSFTAKYGLSSSVMDYIPFNLAPRHAANGDLFQKVLGPYDYHAIAWGYTRVPGAVTPDEEVPALDRIASQWSNPLYRFASDEDVQWQNGHAIDPRVAQFILTGDGLGWCVGQMQIMSGLLGTLDSRFPAVQHVWSEERGAFAAILRPYARCALGATHYIGGEYLSRARRGDPGGTLPLTPVSRQDEIRAFGVLDRLVFSESAWNFSPTTLRRLVYTEHAAFTDFTGEPPLRHDISLAGVASSIQDAALDYLFSPGLLARIADLPSKSRPHQTMTLADLFTWTQRSIFGDIGSGPAKSGEVRRNLQRRYADLLIKLAVAPPNGTPYDAQALARFELTDLERRTEGALSKTQDLQLRAHLEAMRADVRRALQAQTVAPPRSGAPEAPGDG